MRRSLRLLLAVSIALVASAIRAQTIELVADVTPGVTPVSGAYDPVVSGDKLFFVGTTPTEGSELWVTDGTTDGTHIVVDHLPGPSGRFSFPDRTPNGDSGVVFWLSDYGPLWMSDGTESGTIELADLSCGRYQQYEPLPAVGLNGTHYLILETWCDRTLWKTDGTPAGTAMIPGIIPVSLASDGASLWVEATQSIYVSGNPDSGFAAIDANGPSRLTSSGMLYAKGNELWLSTGPGVPSSKLTTFTGFSGIRGIESFDDGIVVRVHGSADDELWLVDWTTLEAEQLLAAYVPYSPLSFLSLGNKALLGLPGELWLIVGTSMTSLATSDTTSTPGGFVLFEGVAYFTFGTSDTGDELWRTDGTNAGTRLVSDINPGSVGSSPGSIRTYENALWFAVDDGLHGRELWRSDGTLAGTQLFLNVNPDIGSSYPFTFLEFGLRTIFSAHSEELGREPWITDAGSTHLLIDYSKGTGSSTLRALGTFNGSAYLGVCGGCTVVKSDGTTAGTLTSDLWLDGGFRYYGGDWFADLGSRLLIYTDKSSSGYLWTTDGTTSGTETVGNTAGRARFAHVGRDVFLVDSAGLKRTDGTAEGTLTISEGWASDIYWADGRIYVMRNQTLWVSDGTSESTQQVYDFGAPKYIAGQHVMGGILYLILSNPDSNHELWASDGTTAGTYKIADLPDEVAMHERVGSHLVLFARDEAGMEPWVSDGTTAGTHRLLDLCPGSCSSVYGGSAAEAVVEGVLYFTATNGLSGRELWRTDGTVAGTYLVEDLVPGAEGSSPDQLSAVRDEVFFSAYQPGIGCEPHVFRPALGVPSIALASPSNPILPGETTNLVATMTNETGDPFTGLVEFLIDDVVYASSIPSGGVATALIVIPGGNHVLRARYGGDGLQHAVRSSGIAVAVSRRPLTLTIDVPSAGGRYGEEILIPFTLSGEVGNPFYPSGIVRVSDAAGELGRVAVINGTGVFATRFLQVGVHDLTLEYEGPNFEAPPVAFSVTVDKAVPTLTFSEDPVVRDPDWGDYTARATFQFPGSLSSDDQRGIFQLLVDGDVVLETDYRSIDTALQLDVGTYTITARFAGNDSWESISKSMILTIAEFPEITSITPDPACIGVLSTMTIRGLHFESSAKVTLDDVETTVSFIDSTMLEALIDLTGERLSISVRVVHDNGASTARSISGMVDNAPPRLTPPPILLVQAGTDGPNRVGDSPEVKAFLEGATAIDNCTTVEWLPPQLDGVDVTDDTLLQEGFNTITFRAQDAGGRIGTAVASIWVIRYGSLNDDDLVDATDLVIMANFLVGNIKFGTVFVPPYEAGDLNQDGVVTAVDLVILQNFLVGNISELPLK